MSTPLPRGLAAQPGLAAAWPLRTRVFAAAMLGLALLAFIASNPWFAVLDDETTIAVAAAQPVWETLSLFLAGTGEHWHPPLSDLLLHGWLLLGGGESLTTLRLPSVLLYLAGLAVLAQAANHLAGPRAVLPLLVLGVLSPYAFHFARLAGWYAWCFFLVAALSLAYIRWLQQASAARATVFALLGLALVASNYLGWALLGLLLLDAWRHGAPARTARRQVLALAALFAVAALPLLPSALGLIEPGSAWPRWTLGAGLNAVYNLFVLFASEAVAPWYWRWSLPVGVAVAASLALAWRHAPPLARRLALDAAVLFLLLAVLGALNTKRLLILMPWVVLSLGTALVCAPPRQRQGLALALLVIGALGWLGTLTRAHYAAMHFVEPWRELAAQTAPAVRAGAVVLTNSRPFSFELHHALMQDDPSSPAPRMPGYAQGERVRSYFETPIGSLDSLRGAPDVRHVVGVQHRMDDDQRVTAWLDAHCLRRGGARLVEDGGQALKQRWFPGYGQRRWRVELTRHDCSQASQTDAGVR